ncbi:alpha/beta hydrolase [Cognaticolwellia aestuarii]|uniref:alpha/beta hydrolase n=1 Tax=Cognaticolwellia aestuarii TaxID=329993 RepID=UPI0009876616|nr:alpha/beta fold hydrolase [Cognaticolwellia aestuarii]
MNNIIKLIFYIFFTALASGCTSIGSYIVSNPEVYLSEAEFIKAKPEEIGFTKHEFCSQHTNECIPYLMAPPYLIEDFPTGSAVYYNLHAIGNGVENTISHTMTPDTFNRIKGTALLLHGYGGNKEVMMATAIYFRALGMNVVMPDLFGHGESKEKFAFASREHPILSQLLRKLTYKKESEELTVVVGHSMGAIAASNLLSSEYVDAAILLAPMMRFDLAAKEYLPNKAPTLNRFFSDYVDDIVTQTMVNASITLEETDLLINLNESNKPTLLVNSNIDSISPPNYFLSVKNKYLTKLIFEDRAHSSLMVFNKEDSRKIEKWLFGL